MDNYDKLSLTHSSPQSKVYSAFSTADQQRYILKFLRRTHSHPQTYQKQLALHQGLSHDNIVHFKASFLHIEKGIDYEVMVLEYCSGGSLDLALPSETDLVTRIGWLLDAARGLHYLHSKDIVHRDVKPENIFLSRGRAKVGDFGNAILKRLTESQDKTSKLGTLWYSSPQNLQGDLEGSESDVWSLGIACLEVIANQRINQLLQGLAPPAKRKDFPSEQLLQCINEEKLRKLVKKMLSRKKEKRPKMEAVVQKLDKRLASLRRCCQTEALQLNLPLQQQEISGEGRLEWLHRISPKKQNIKPEKYKLKTDQNGQVIVKYDDYRQTLKVTYQQMQITYDYATLPLSLKNHFRNLSELNAALKNSNTKLSFTTNGALLFPFKARLPYDPAKALSKSMAKSDKSSLTILQNDQKQILPERDNLLSKYKQTQAIPQEEHQNLSERLSAHSGSKSTAKSYNFGQQLRDNKENEDLARIEEEIQENNIETQSNTNKTTSQTRQRLTHTQYTHNLPQEQQIKQPQQKKPPSTSFKSQNNQTRIASFSPPPPRPQYVTPPTTSVNPKVIQDLTAQIAILKKVSGPQNVLLPDHYLTLSRMHLNNKDKEKCQECLHKAIYHFKQSRRQYSDDCAKAHYYLANLYLDRNEKEEDSQQNSYQKTTFVFDKKREFVQTEKQALKQLQIAVNILYNLRSYDFVIFSKVYNALGELYLNTFSLNTAQDYFLDALRCIKDPTGRKESRLSFKPTLNLGKLYLKWLKQGDAKPYFQQALQLLPKNATNLTEMSIRNHLQACCLSLRDLPSGLDHLQRCFVLACSTEDLGKKSKMMGMMKKEHKKWTKVLLDEKDPRVKQHLVTLRRLFKEYFDQPDQEQTETILSLESKIDSLPDRY